MELATLLQHRVVAPRVVVKDLVLDSRQVKPGDAFVAVGGQKTHGLEHVGAAISRGATAVLWEPTPDLDAPVMPPSVTAVAVPGLRRALGELADRFYGSPSSALDVAAVTGTNGKTTCAWLHAVARGERGGYLGTIGAGHPPTVAPTTHTTLDVLSLHRQLAAFRDEGLRHIAIEVSSHALDQERVAGVRMPVVGFTNLTRDHLDYHGTMESYGAAKERLLHCAGVRHAVVNVDDAFGAGLASARRAASRSPGSRCRRVSPRGAATSSRTRCAAMRAASISRA